MSLTCQEVDEPLQLDMSELCLSDDLIQGNNGKPHFRYIFQVRDDYSFLHF